MKSILMRRMPSLHVNINCRLSKIYKLYYIPNQTNAPVIESSKTKVDNTVLNNKMEVEGKMLVFFDNSEEDKE